MTTVMRRGRLAQALRDAVIAVPGVSRLVGSGAVEVAAQFPGGKVPGVDLGADTPAVYIAVSRLPVGPVAEWALRAAQEAMAAAGDDRPVQIVVADLDVDSLPRQE